MQNTPMGHGNNSPTRQAPFRTQNSLDFVMAVHTLPGLEKRVGDEPCSWFAARLCVSVALFSVWFLEMLGFVLSCVCSFGGVVLCCVVLGVQLRCCVLSGV